MNEEKEPKRPFAGIVYGEVVYWTVLAASIIVIIGSVVAFVTRMNFVSPSYWICSLWQGKHTGEIWGEFAAVSPVGHWYLNYLGTGDGLTAFGISLGVFSVTLGMVVAAIILLKEKRTFLGLLALVAATITVISMLGLTGICFIPLVLELDIYLLSTFRSEIASYLYILQLYI